MLLIENFEIKWIWSSTKSNAFVESLDPVDNHIDLKSKFSINNMNSRNQKIIWKFVYIVIGYVKGFET